ncbi:hypothetical protein NMY22_g16364 [Coprinellus aureogranulatus]|nr:hypothetical protein NMY22_g16364 [Coprinellus aureogranulatus]
MWRRNTLLRFPRYPIPSRTWLTRSYFQTNLVGAIGPGRQIPIGAQGSASAQISQNPPTSSSHPSFQGTGSELLRGAPPIASHVNPVDPPAPVPNLLDDDDSDPAAALLQGLPRSSFGVSPNALQPSTLAASAAPPPPRPPNPELLALHQRVHERLTSELHSLSKAFELDAERLRATQRDLLQGEPAIKDETARLEAVRNVCFSVADRTRNVVEKVEGNINDLKRKGDPNVDEMVCATTIVHNQLLNLVAEDNAIEDTVYHLHRALNSGRIDLERFLRDYGPLWYPNSPAAREAGIATAMAVSGGPYDDAVDKRPVGHGDIA